MKIDNRWMRTALGLLCVIVFADTCPSAWAAERQADQTKLLISQLRSRQGAERQTAAILLGRLKTPEAAAPLLRALKRECLMSPERLKRRGWEANPMMGDYDALSGRLRSTYCFVLAQMGPTVEPQVRAALKDAPKAFAGYLWVILGMWQRGDALEPLLDLLKNGKDGYTRAHAATALGYLGNKAAIPGLKAALSDDFEAVFSSDTRLRLVRECAQGALYKLGVRVERGTPTGARN